MNNKLIAMYSCLLKRFSKSGIYILTSRMLALCTFKHAYHDEETKGAPGKSLLVNYSWPKAYECICLF